jgi:PAS domain S-box-containing protein
MLTELAVQLNSYDFRSVDYKTIAENARRMTGAAFVMLNKFEPDGTSFVTKAISGDNQAIQKAIDLFGDDFLKKEWPFDEVRQKLVGAKKTTEFERLSDLTGGVIPDFVINQISNLFGLGKVYVVITRNQGIRGDLTLIYPKGHFLQHQDLIEAYTDLVGMTFSRLEAERILDEQRQELQQFFSVSIDMLCVVDTTGRFLRVNEAWEHVLGYPNAEFLLKNYTDIVHSEDHQITHKAFSELIHGGQLNGFVNRCTTKDGNLRYLEWKAFLRGEFVYASARDISNWVQVTNELKSKSEQLQTAKNIAEKASQAKSEFLANMSHEIRTPLNGVIGFTELLKRTKLDAVQRQYVDHALVSGQSLLGIINNVLDLSKIEAGRLELDLVHTDIITLVQQSCEMMSFHANEKNLLLRVVIQPDIPRFVMADPVRIRQIIINLLGNAIKFTQDGFVEFSLKFFGGTESQKHRGRFEFSVKDSGIGIQDAQRDRIFKAFSQGDASVTRKYGGTGLGLVISNLLAEKMGDRIHFESQPGKGSHFWFSMYTEILDSVEAESLKSPDSNDTTQLEGKNPLILIVEDIKLNMLLVKTLVKQAYPGAIVIEAENGQLAVELFSSRQPDLILMDVQMPVMDGLEATAHIRKLESDLLVSRNIPIIALTAGALSEERVRCVEAGMNGFLTKPIEPSVLMKVLGDHL